MLAAFNVVSGTTQVASSVYAGSQSLVKQGAGTLVLSAANTYSGGTVVEQGTLVVRNPAALGSGVVEVRSGAKLVLDGGGSGRFEVSSLVLQPGGLIDVGTSQLSIQSGFTQANLLAALNQAMGAGSWNGQSGIGSSVVSKMVASGASRTLGWVGWLTNDDLSCVVGFAAAGDTNLDGQVDSIDYINFISGFSNPENEQTWSTGDFTYDGLTDFFDALDLVAAGAADTNYRPIDPPTAPLSLSAAPLSTTAIKLDWITVGNPQGFEIEQSADGVSGWQAVAPGRQNLSRSGTATSVTIGGFSAGQSAFFRVRSYDNSPSWWWDDRYRSADTPTVSAKTQIAEPTNLYWDPDGIPSNNNTITGAGLGGSGVWSDGGEADWFDPKLNNGAGGYVPWDSTRDVAANFAGAGSAVTIVGTVSASQVVFSGSGYVLSGGAFKTAATVTDFRAMVSAEIKTPIQGTGGINKRGVGTLVVSALVNTYTGDTTVALGKLDVRGTIQSHVKPTSPDYIISGVMFYDPDLAMYVRDALGLPGDVWLTQAVLAACEPLTNLAVNGTAIGDLTGIGNLSSLTSLSFIPADYSVAAVGITTLAPLAGLTSLTKLRLHDVGLTDAVLDTLPNLSALKSLDLRYNALTTVPASIANLPRLSQLFVHGNTRLTDSPLTGLVALKGKAIDVDIAPNRPELATDIQDLANRLYLLPLKMLEYVTNTIAYQPYVGAMKGPLATLQTKAGNDWDTNSLLAELYKAAGIRTRYVPGIARVTTSRPLMDYVGARDPSAAHEILRLAGLREQDDRQGTFRHTWLEALVNVPTNGAPGWVRLDASWKLRDFRPGLPGMLSNVPFSPLEVDYLRQARWQKESVAAYYEAQVADWLARYRDGLTIADVGYDGPIRMQAFKSLPSDLPYIRDTEPPELERPTQIPDSANYRVNIKLANGASQLFGDSGVEFASLADVSLSRLTIDPQFSADTNTSRPVLRRDGGFVTPPAAATVIANAKATQLALTVTVNAPAGGTTYSQTFIRSADRFIAIGLDANQFSESLLATKRGIANAQQLNQANGMPVDREQAIGGLLDLAITQYFTAADADEASIAALTSAVPDRTTVALGIATSGPALTPVNLSTGETLQLQFPYLPTSMRIDVPRNVWGGFAIDQFDDASKKIEIDLARYLLMGYANSALESLTLEELTNFESVSTMKAFQIAAASADDLSNFVEIDSSNVGVLGQLSWGSSAKWVAIRSKIADIVQKGIPGIDALAGMKYRVRVPKIPITIGSGDTQWSGVGYTVTSFTSDPTKAHLNGKTNSYIIHGGIGNDLDTLDGGAASNVRVAPTVIKATLPASDPNNYKGDPVNVANGNVYHEETDFEIPNLGTPLAFRRRYDSIHTVSGLSSAPQPWSDRGMGEGWSFSYSDRIEPEADGANTVTWFTDIGMRLVFTRSVNGFTNPAGTFGNLTGSAATGFTWKDYDGNTTKFGDAANGFCPITSTRDRFGNGVAITYVAGTNRIDKVSDRRNAGRCIAFTYNADARPHIESIRDSTSTVRTWTYGYQDGRLQTRTAPAPEVGTAEPVVRYDYHPDAAQRGLLRQVTDPSGFVTAWEYYANRRGFRVIDAEGLRHSFAYNLFRRQSAFIDERGSAFRYSYDVQGNLLGVQQPDRTIERSTWYANGLRQSSTDAYGQIRTFEYDPVIGKVTKVIDPTKSVTTTTYTTGLFRDIDTLTKGNDPTVSSDDVVTDFVYDDSERFLTKRIEDYGPGRLNLTTLFEPTTDGRGLVWTTTSPGGTKTTYAYNAAGQIESTAVEMKAGVGTIPAETEVEVIKYDEYGNPQTRTDGRGNVTTYGFDKLGRKETETSADPDGSSGPLPALKVTTHYDVAGNADSSTLGDGRVTLTAYDRRQRVVRRTEADGTYSLRSYDAAGNLATSTDALGRVTTYVYDARNRLVATLLPDGTTTRVRLDGGGRIVATIDQSGATTTFAYDTLGRKIRETLPDPDGAGSAVAPSTAWGYYPTGFLKFVTPNVANQPDVELGDRNWSTTYTYQDALGRKRKERQADPDGTGPVDRPVTSFEYDADGNLKSVTDPRGFTTNDPQGFTTSYGYDRRGRKTSETSPDPDGAGPLGPLVTSYRYDKAGNLQYEIAPGGQDENDGSYVTSHFYDALNREYRTSLPYPDGPDGTRARPTSWRTFNASGYVDSTTNARDYSTTFTYDKLGRSYAVTDALGGKTRTFRDAVGNIVISTDELGRRTFTTYDSMNRPVTVRSPRPDSTSATPVTTTTYDVVGNPIASTDALGRVTQRQYDTLGRQISQTDALALRPGDSQHTTRTEYDSAGRVTATIDELGQRTDTVYDNLGRKIRTVAPDAGQGPRTTYFGYDAAGNLRYTTDPRGAGPRALGFTTYIFYDALGRKTSTVDALAPVTVTGYWSDSDAAIPDLLPSTVTTNVTRTVYDPRGRVQSTIDSLNQKTDYFYDNLGRKGSAIAPDPDGASGPLARPVTLYGYDPAGNVTSVYRTSWGAKLSIGETYAYDALDRRTTVTDGRGFSTVTAYDLAGNVTSVTDASRNVTGYTYDRLDRVVTETDPLKVGTSYAYDLVGNKIKETDRLRRVTSFVYDAADRLIEEQWQASASAAVSHTIKRYYDNADQLLGVTETDTANPAATAAWQYTYDAAGNVVKSRMAPGEFRQTLAVSSYQGILTSTDQEWDWDSDGKAERFVGRQITLAAGDQVLIRASSSVFNAVVFLQRPGGNVRTAFFAESSGGGTAAELLVAADVAGTWTIGVTSRDESAAGAYDLKWTSGNVIVPGAAVEYDFGYDKAGNLAWATEDQAAAAVSLLLPSGQTLNGSVANGLGMKTSYGVNALDQVKSYRQLLSGTNGIADVVAKRALYNYRDDGSVDTVTRYAAASDTAPVGTSTASYYYDSRLKGITHAPSSSSESISYGYTYDAAGRMETMTTPEGKSTFTLDAADQLLSASGTNENYTYDNTGNRTTPSTVGGFVSLTGTGNRLVFDGAYRYAYDAEGNRTAKFLDLDLSQTLSPGDTDVTAYAYDQRNRPVAVSHVSAWTTAQEDARDTQSTSGLPGSDLDLLYTYDYADRRIRRVIDEDGKAGSGSASVSFAAYAGDVRTLEIKQQIRIVAGNQFLGMFGEVIQRNFYGNGQDEILAVDKITWSGPITARTPTTSTFWTFTDHQDSVRDIVSGNAADRGKVVEHRQYDSFGKIVRRTTGPQAGAATTAGVEVEFGYGGRPFEARSGLSDNRARWYEPGTGRFINEDPSGFKGGDVNLFRYVGNDPLNKVDPSGLAPNWTGGAKASVPAAAWGGFGWQTPITPATTPSTSAMAFASLRSQPVAATPTFSIPAPTLTVSTSGGNVYSPVSTQTYSPSSSVAAEGGYLTRSVKSLVFGDWTDTNPTALSIGVGVGLGLVGADLPMDLRDLGHTVTHPEWSYDWGKRLAINSIAVLPIVGAIKYAKYLDDAAAFQLPTTSARSVVADFASEGGEIGGRLYGAERLGKLGRYLERRGVTLEVGSPALEAGKAGSFVTYPGGNARLLLKADPTNELVWHELGHFTQWRRLGNDAYRALPRTQAFNAPEQHVFDLLERPTRWNRLTPEYRIHSAEYIEDVGGFR
ncbi:MAG: RHS repeat-associated core domain-containing protein [Planctomycetota bacterium]